MNSENLTIDVSTLVLGDDINTDDIIPANRCTSAEPEHLGRYVLEHIIDEGQLFGVDRIRAGKNFGCGSSREHAPIALKAAGINSVQAVSFAEIFYRNSINIGLELLIEGSSGNDPVIQGMIDAGGLMAFNRMRLAEQSLAPKSRTLPRPQTMAEKLLARASGNSYVAPGEIVFAKVDLAMSHDAVTGPIAEVFHENFGSDRRVWDPDKIVLVADHFIQVNDIRPDQNAHRLYEQMTAFAEEQQCHLLDQVSPGEAQGICHVLLPELGYVKPGQIIAGTDSHSCTYGAFGCFGTGVGTTDMANVFATGDMWIRVPATQVFELTGTLPPDVCAKDIMLYILEKIGCDGAAGDVIEFRGSVVEALPMEERMTLSNMAIECGAVCGLIAVDDTTLSHLGMGGSLPPETVFSDSDARFKIVHELDLTNLQPKIARPSKPDQVVDIKDVSGVAITRAFIGSCTGGKLHDLAEAAKVLEGKRVAQGVDLFIVPASQHVREEAQRLGYLQIFEQAGATILKSGCGACINAGPGGLGKDETGIYATNRNFKGRSGDPSANNYLASPRSVALAAIEGRIGP